MKTDGFIQLIKKGALKRLPPIDHIELVTCLLGSMAGQVLQVVDFHFYP